MADKKAVPVILGLGAGALALVLLARRAKAVPPVVEVPTVDDIMGAKDFAELDNYYYLIAGLFTIGKIDRDTYMTLYEAYRERWYQLIGGSE